MLHSWTTLKVKLTTPPPERKKKAFRLQMSFFQASIWLYINENGPTKWSKIREDLKLNIANADDATDILVKKHLHMLWQDYLIKITDKHRFKEQKKNKENYKWIFNDDDEVECYKYCESKHSKIDYRPKESLEGRNLKVDGDIIAEGIKLKGRVCLIGLMKYHKRSTLKKLLKRCDEKKPKLLHKFQWQQILEIVMGENYIRKTTFAEQKIVDDENDAQAHEAWKQTHAKWQAAKAQAEKDKVEFLEQEPIYKKIEHNNDLVDERDPSGLFVYMA